MPPRTLVLLSSRFLVVNLLLNFLSFVLAYVTFKTRSLFVWLHQVLGVAHGHSSCGMLAYFPMACGVLVLQPGIQPVSPVLKGRFTAPEPLGKSLCKQSPSLHLYL